MINVAPSRIKAQHTISMGHRLPSYDGICSSPHGHNIIVEAVVITGPEFFDFKTLKVALEKIIEPMDHAMVLHVDDPLAKVLATHFAGFRMVLLNVEPTTENIAQFIFNKLAETAAIRSNLVSVTVHETDKYSATALCVAGVVVAAELPEGL